jgi:hypothetical protein
VTENHAASFPDYYPNHDHEKADVRVHQLSQEGWLQRLSDRSMTEALELGKECVVDAATLLRAAASSITN